MIKIEGGKIYGYCMRDLKVVRFWVKKLIFVDIGEGIVVKWGRLLLKWFFGMFEFNDIKLNVCFVEFLNFCWIFCYILFVR